MPFALFINSCYQQNHFSTCAQMIRVPYLISQFYDILSVCEENIWLTTTNCYQDKESIAPYKPVRFTVSEHVIQLLQLKLQMHVLILDRKRLLMQ